MKDWDVDLVSENDLALVDCICKIKEKLQEMDFDVVLARMGASLEDKIEVARIKTLISDRGTKYDAFEVAAMAAAAGFKLTFNLEET